MNNIVVWALFDDANRSYYKALEDWSGVNVISIGINDLEEPNYVKCDLSVTNTNKFKILDKLPKPHIILASPPCESWSIADNQQANLKAVSEETLTIRNRKWFKLHNEVCHVAMKRDYFKATSTRLLGESTANGLVQIIEHYKPYLWVIENPRTSKLWKYLAEVVSFVGCHYNLAHYNCYDSSFTKKPTWFVSNVKLDLEHYKVKQTIKWGETSGYTRRSSIPKTLIQCMFLILTKELDKILH